MQTHPRNRLEEAQAVATKLGFDHATNCALSAAGATGAAAAALVHTGNAAHATNILLREKVRNTKWRDDEKSQEIRIALKLAARAAKKSDTAARKAARAAVLAEEAAVLAVRAVETMHRRNLVELGRTTTHACGDDVRTGQKAQNVEI